jgi:chromosome segregation ATPase
LIQIEFKSEQLDKLKKIEMTETTLGQDQLDQKTTFEQDYELLQEEADRTLKQKQQNREQILKLQIKYSQLQNQNEKDAKELQALDSANEKLQRQNAEREAKNAATDKEIQALIKRIDVNTLLKEVDMQELELMAQSTEQMNVNFLNMLNRWEIIKKDVE